MLARSRKLHLTDARPVSGPLLVPSVSSKGFPLVAAGSPDSPATAADNRVSESGKAIEIVGPDITDALLISAYDIHHGLLLDCDGLLSDQLDATIYAEARLLVVDSGGYELNAEEFESGEVNRQPRASLPFTKEHFTSIVDRLPTTGNILVVSFDSPQLPRQTYAEQRIEAQQFFSIRTHLKSDFLLKPEGSKPYIDVSSLTADASNLRAFDVIGVTEKELGATLLDRMTTLARLRTLLDETGSFERPIHLFGSLDPLLTPLYFMAG